jgi:hypothetical protein
MPAKKVLANLTFEQYQLELSVLTTDVKNASKAINGFAKESNGLTPDHIRALPEFQEAKSKFNIAFAKMRSFNGTISAKFKRRNSCRNTL